MANNPSDSQSSPPSEPYAAELKALREEYDRFAYIVSHDLNAPLRHIKILSQWITQELGDEAEGEVKEYLAELENRVHHMSCMLEGILKYSRVTRAKSEPVPYALNQVMQAVASRVVLPEGFTLALPDSEARLTGEPDKLGTVLELLVDNAVKHHHRDQGHIKVSVTGPKQGYYEVAVQDDGPGIAPEYHERIFDIFYRRPQSDEDAGAGVGLTTAKKLVEENGGRLSVESAEGKGARFLFTWPETTF